LLHEQPTHSRTDRAGTSWLTARALDRSLLHGIAWTSAPGLASWLAWTSTLIVARLLMPVDYGLVGMASIYLGVITLISEFGVGSAVITLRDLTRSRWRSSTVSRCCSGLPASPALAPQRSR